MKRRWRERTERLAADLLEVPKDTLEHVPRIIMIGDSQIAIENYRAIDAFSSSIVRIALAKGHMTIRGEDLIIKTIVPEELVVEGTVQSVVFD